MPTYEYECQHGHRITRRAPMSARGDAVVDYCPTKNPHRDPNVSGCVYERVMSAPHGVVRGGTPRHHS